MAARGVRVEGFDNLDEALRELPRNLARGVVRRAVKAAGDMMADEQIARVPVATGNLKESSVVRVVIRNLTGLGEYAQVRQSGGSAREATSALRSARRSGGSEGSRVTVVVGFSAPHAHLVEFGTVERFHIGKGEPGISRQRMKKLGIYGGRSTGVMPANPYIRPAFDSKKDEAVKIMGRQLATEIEKTKARMARKAARKARV